MTSGEHQALVTIAVMVAFLFACKLAEMINELRK